MQNSIRILACVLLLAGCATTTPEPEFSHLPVAQNEMLASHWQGLNRFPARYPVQAVVKSLEGCATIEYVISPQNEIKDVVVVAATHHFFAEAAQDVVKKWRWSELPKNIISQAVKTQTRFDFCFDTAEQSCATITPQYSCPASDIIYSTGSVIKKVIKST